MQQHRRLDFSQFLRMILRTHCGATLLLCATIFIFTAHCDVIDRPKRDAFANDPKGYLDAIIGHLIYSIPNKIDDAVSSGEASLRLARAKRVTQGWSIVVASWNDILSDYVANNRSIGNLGDYTVVYNYGFLGAYGIGFGYPLLLGLPEDVLTCGSENFRELIHTYGLENGVNGLVHQGVSKSSILSLIGEYKLFSAAKLNCVLSRFGDELDAAELEWNLQELEKALELRAELESDTKYRFAAQNRNFQRTSEDLVPANPVVRKEALTSLTAAEAILVEPASLQQTVVA